MAPISDRDRVITSCVPPTDATLVARNRRAFERAPGLTLETWDA